MDIAMIIALCAAAAAWVAVILQAYWQKQIWERATKALEHRAEAELDALEAQEEAREEVGEQAARARETQEAAAAGYMHSFR